VSRCNELVATDTIYLDAPAIDDGSKMCTNLFTSYRYIWDEEMKTNREFITTLEDNICIRGAMSKLISDRATAEINNKI
jgi:hypothetical protein